MRRAAAAVLLPLLLSAPARADTSLPPPALADTQLPDPQAEAQAAALMSEVRCLVCQGQSIADSDADLAGDMRAMIRQRVAAGEPPETIRRWLVRRYGPWISFRPPASALGWPLWVAPLLLLAAGVGLALGRLRTRR